MNALLSLGYTLLGWEIVGLLDSHGLDPYLGFYHQTRRGLPALAQDVLEEFRAPVVDRLAVALVNTGKIGREDFTPGPRGGLRLKNAALRRFLGLYEVALMSEFKSRDGSCTVFRRLIDHQCREMRSAVVGDSPYKPFAFQRG